MDSIDRSVGWVESSRPTRLRRGGVVGLEDSTHPTHGLARNPGVREVSGQMPVFRWTVLNPGSTRRHHSASHFSIAPRSSGDLLPWVIARGRPWVPTFS